MTEIDENVEPEIETKSFHVWIREGNMSWKFVGPVQTDRYTPQASEIGEAYGEGEFLVVEDKKEEEEAWRRSNFYGTIIKVISEKFYREKYDSDDE